MRPAAYIELRDGREVSDPDDRFNWGGRTVQNILERPEYMGDTVNFRTRKVSFKSKKMVTNSPDDWYVFRDTQEPIVSREVWETAQKCRVVKRRANSTGEYSRNYQREWQKKKRAEKNAEQGAAQPTVAMA